MTDDSPAGCRFLKLDDVKGILNSSPRPDLGPGPAPVTSTGTSSRAGIIFSSIQLIRWNPQEIALARQRHPPATRKREVRSVINRVLKQGKCRRG